MSGAARALLGSFAVYLVPLVTVHTVTLTGAYLAQSWRRGRPDSLERLALEWAAVLLAQVALFSALWLVRRAGAWLQAVVGLTALGGCLVFLNLTLLLAIPLRILVEDDPAPERTGLTEDCAVPRAALHAWETPLSMAERGEAFLFPTDGATLRLLRMPGCQVLETGVPTNAAYLSAQPGGVALFGVLRPGDPRASFFLGRGPQAAPVDLGPWRPEAGAPRLLADARTAAWIERRTTAPGFAPPEPPVAAIRTLDLDTGRTGEIPVAALLGGFLLLGGDGPRGPFVVERQMEGREIYVLDGQGRATGPPLVPEPDTRLSDGLDRLVLLGGGWVGWSLYEEERRYAVAWALRAGSGRHELRRGRGITSVAVDPEGAYVAVSATTALNIGAIRDSVVLLRTSDGVEVFRRYFPTYHRSAVALLGRSRWFALTDAPAGAPTVRVYSLPPAS